MTREEKEQSISELTEKLEKSSNFYLTDISGLTVTESNNLRRLCFNKGVELKVVKNTLLRKAMERAEGNYDESYEVLKGNTALFFSESGSLPAKLIKDFRKKSERPILKAAFVEQTFYFGDEELNTLATIKSKNELIGDIIGLLQSPITNVISGLKSGGSTLSGLLKALEERPEQAAKVEEPVTESKSDESPAAEAKVEETQEPSASSESSESAEGNESSEEAKSEDGATETATESEEEKAPEENNEDASTDNSDEEGETSEDESEPKNEN